MPRPLVSALVSGVAALVLLAAALPRRPAPVAPAGRVEGPPVVAGAFHVHTQRSDGAAGVERIAVAAAAAGLDFVVLTDHGDGTRAPEPPAYHAGVLVLDGVEISTSGGHYAAVGMRQAPYPLGGEPRDVVEDVARLGGVGVVSHGDSPKPELAWTDWESAFAGLEWLNLDSEWRRATPVRLALGFTTYWLRGPESIASVLSRPALLDRFDRVAAVRPVFLLATTDAHGGLPTYEACFRTLTTRVELDAPFGGEAPADAAALVAALAAGRHYTAIDALAGPPALDFSARADGAHGRAVRMGGLLPEGVRSVFEVRAAAPAGAVLRLLRDGVVTAEAAAPALRYEADGARAVYRVEVHLPRAPGIPPVPWIVGNPIYVGHRSPPHAPPPPAVEVLDLTPPGYDGVWTTARDDRSRASVGSAADAQPGFAFEYALAEGEPSDQFAATGTDAPADLPRYDRLTLTGRASRPLRLAVQLQQRTDAGGRRWQRSVYLDQDTRTVVIPFDDLTPAPGTPPGPPILPAIDDLVLHIDTNHALPGTEGRVELDYVAFERARP